MTKPRAKGAGPSKGAPRTTRTGREQHRSEATGEEAHLQYDRKNYLLLGLGGLVLVIGFLLLAVGDTTIAPVLLVGGYLVLIPWGIVANRKSSSPPGAGKSP